MLSRDVGGDEAGCYGRHHSTEYHNSFRPLDQKGFGLSGCPHFLHVNPFLFAMWEFPMSSFVLSLARTYTPTNHSFLQGHINVESTLPSTSVGDDHEKGGVLAVLRVEHRKDCRVIRHGSCRWYHLTRMMVVREGRMRPDRHHDTTQEHNQHKPGPSRGREDCWHAHLLPMLVSFVLVPFPRQGGTSRPSIKCCTSS